MLLLRGVVGRHGTVRDVGYKNKTRRFYGLDERRCKVLLRQMSGLQCSPIMEKVWKEDKRTRSRELHISPIKLLSRAICTASFTEIVVRPLLLIASVNLGGDGDA